MEFLLDQNNRPQLYFHGTRREFDQFLPNELGLIHLSSCKEQAREFSLYPRGDRQLPVVEPRIVCAHVKTGQFLDTANSGDLMELAGNLDWEEVVQQIQEFSQSPWTQGEARRWLEEGQWQILELDCVLEVIKERYEGLVMYELGVRNLAVFSPEKIKIVGVEILPENKKPSMRP